MDGFTLPKEFDDFITSASDLLSQYKQHSNNQFQDFLVFRIFLDGSTDTTLDTMTTLRQEVMTIILPLTKHYMWHKDSLRVKVIVPEDKSPIYLGGVLEFGDCVDDEWFVVSLLYEVSKQIPRISISVTDTDGQFLLIEASSADIPDWIGPENSENRVWIKGGQLDIIPLDEAGRKRSGVLLCPRHSLCLPPLTRKTRTAPTVHLQPGQSKRHFYQESNPHVPKMKLSYITLQSRYPRRLLYSSQLVPHSLHTLSLVCVPLMNVPNTPTK